MAESSNRWNAKYPTKPLINKLSRVITLSVLTVGYSIPQAMALPFTTTEISKYLVIATGEGKRGDDFEAFNMSNTEIGANQELISTSGNGSPSQVTGSLPSGSSPNLADVFIPTRAEAADGSGNSNRWNDNAGSADPNDHPGDIVGLPDTLPGARPLYEGRDFSGNVALTGEYAEFGSSNSDVHADATIGIQCKRASASDCLNPSSNNSFFDKDAPNTEEDLNAHFGINVGFNSDPLTQEMEKARDEIVSLATEFVIDETYRVTNLENNNIKDSGSPFITDLDAIDINGDGIAVIDIDIGDNTFLVNNTDWILQSTRDVFAIIRMADGTNFDFSNSSILLGDGINESTDLIYEMGALFFMDAYQGTNEVFNLNNVILGGVGLWDFTDFNPRRDELLYAANDSMFTPASSSNGYDRTVVNAGQNVQGCSQFIGNQILMSNARWNKCGYSQPVVTDIPEPESIVFWALGFSLILLRRRNTD